MERKKSRIDAFVDVGPGQEPIGKLNHDGKQTIKVLQKGRLDWIKKMWRTAFTYGIESTPVEPYRSSFKRNGQS